MSKKRVFLAAPDNFGLYKLIVTNLEYLGYEVTHIEDKMDGFRYKSITERLYNTCRKILFKDKAYKEKLKKAYNLRSQIEHVNKHDYYDFVLVIRADFFEPKVLELLRSKTSKMISFHFDGVAKDSKVLDSVKFFDKFYVFDKNDVSTFSTYNFLYSTNFYFDFPESDPALDMAFSDVFYVSSFEQSRVQSLVDLHQELTKIYDKVRFLLMYKKDRVHLLPQYIRDNMEITFRYVSFAEQLQQVKNSKVIVDLVIDSHHGLSFRVFEGLKYGIKVITTNKTIVEADFYHPNNFFILNEDNYNQIKGFLQLPYMPYDNDVIVKYSFTNWLNSKIDDE